MAAEADYCSVLAKVLGKLSTENSCQLAFLDFKLEQIYKSISGKTTWRFLALTPSNLNLNLIRSIKDARYTIFRITQIHCGRCYS